MAQAIHGAAPDIGGDATTMEFTDAVIDWLRNN